MLACPRGTRIGRALIAITLGSRFRSGMPNTRAVTCKSSASLFSTSKQAASNRQAARETGAARAASDAHSSIAVAVT